MGDSTNRGPVAPKDPTKKRPFFYITKDKEIFGAPQPDGSLAHLLYMDMGRLIDAARLTGNVTDEAMVENLTTTAGLRRMIHSIGVSVSGKATDSKVKFVVEMYPNTPGEKTTSIEAELLMDGMETVIELGSVDWKDGDRELGQIRFLFDKPGITATTDIRFYLNDGFEAPEQPEDIKKKIMSMFTDPGHLKVEDPGKTEGNPVFIYLEAFATDEHFAKYWPDYANLDELKAHYERGGLGDVKVKKFLNRVLEDTLEPIRARRAEYEKDIAGVYDILKEGTRKAREMAAETLAMVKGAMKIDYFNDPELVARHQEKYGN